MSLSQTRSMRPSHGTRVVEHSSTTRTLRVPEGALRGLLAGAEGALLSWLVIVIPTIATYVATAAAPSLGSAVGLEAARIGTGVWLLGHGSIIESAEFSITVVPLGVTLISVALMAGAVRRARLLGWVPAVIAVAVYVLLAVMFVSFAQLPGASRGIVGALTIAGLGAVIGLPKESRPGWVPGLLERIPEPVRLAWGAAWRGVAVLIGLAVAAFLASVVAHIDQIREIHDRLDADPVSTGVLVLAQLLIVPNLISYTAAFLLGPGFSIGTGTIFSPTAIDAGPLPVVPILGALPEPDGLAGQVPLLGLLGLVAGLIAGVWVAGKTSDRRPLTAGATVVLSTGFAVSVVATFTVLASGAIGPGAMAQVGGEPTAVALAFLWQFGVPVALVVVLGHPMTRQVSGAAADRVRSAGRTWWAQVRGEEYQESP